MSKTIFNTGYYPVSTDAGAISGIITPSHGGTGQSSLTPNTFLVGNGTLPVLTTKVVPTGIVVGTSDAQTLTNKTATIAGGNNLEALTLRGVTPTSPAPAAGNVLVATGSTGAAWGQLPMSSLSGILTVPQGGTGVATLSADHFITGNGTGPVLSNVLIPIGDVVGTTDTQTLTSKTMTIADDNVVEATSIKGVTPLTAVPSTGDVLVAISPTTASWSQLPVSSLNGVIPVANGGTGQSAIPAGKVLVGSGANFVDVTKNAPTGQFVGTTDTQTMTNKTMLYDLTNEIHATHLTSVELIDAPPPGVGLTQALVRTNSNFGVWRVMTFANLTGSASAAQGGTGNITLTAGNFLIGNGTAAVNTTKVAPGGVVVGTTDGQTLTNKTMLWSAGNLIQATGIRSVDVDLAVPTANQILVATSGTTATWQNVPAGSLSGVVPVANGGTGATTLTAGNFLVGNGTGVVSTTKAVPGGAVVGTTDGQTITNKTMLWSAGNLVQATGLRSVDVDLAVPTANQILVATSGTAATWQNASVALLTGTLPVTSGGTGAITLTSGNFLVGNGTGAVATTKVVPGGAVVGTTDNQTLTNKTMTTAGGNSIQANSLYSVQIDPFAPTAGQFLYTNNSTSALWTTLSASLLSGVVAVTQGGTGLSFLNNNRFMVGNGTAAVDLTKVIPTGTVVGDTDNQTITNKTMLSATNNIQANSLRTVAVSAVAPTAGQALVATSGVAAAWASILTGIPRGDVSYGDGTTITTGNITGAAWLPITVTNFAGTYTLAENNATFTSAKFDNGGTAGQLRWLGAATSLQVTFGLSFAVTTVQLGLARYRVGLLLNGTVINSTIIWSNPSAATTEFDTVLWTRRIAVATNSVLSVAVSNTNNGGGIIVSAMSLSAVADGPIIL